jgi:hypothetical protein
METMTHKAFSTEMQVSMHSMASLAIWEGNLNGISSLGFSFQTNNIFKLSIFNSVRPWRQLFSLADTDPLFICLWLHFLRFPGNVWMGEKSKENLDASELLELVGGFL